MAMKLEGHPAIISGIELKTGARRQWMHGKSCLLSASWAFLHCTWQWKQYTVCMVNAFCVLYTWKIRWHQTLSWNQHKGQIYQMSNNLAPVSNKKNVNVGNLFFANVYHSNSKSPTLLLQAPSEGWYLLLVYVKYYLAHQARQRLLYKHHCCYFKHSTSQLAPSIIY